MSKLLTRDNFREGVFARDGHKCVVCGIQNVPLDAHHILERRLWSDGGYYLDNGATVCEEHHLACERTDISVEQIREYAGVKKIIPENFYDDVIYDKWGNIILPNGQRMIGELFFDESVQKILASHLDEFTHYVKYPRTYHLPWSEGMNEDDRMHQNMNSFIGKRVIVTEKMDGENTTMYSDYIHARSIDGRNHISRNWVKNYWSTISQDIPDNWRICGENLFAKHSIQYDDLKSYFYGFSVWNEFNRCLSWDETVEWFKLIGIVSVPVLFDGIYDEKKIRDLYNSSQWAETEGYVLRIADEFEFKDFNKSVGKFVRKGHIQTTKHWMFGQKMEINNVCKI